MDNVSADFAPNVLDASVTLDRFESNFRMMLSLGHAQMKEVGSPELVEFWNAYEQAFMEVFGVTKVATLYQLGMMADIAEMTNAKDNK